MTVYNGKNARISVGDVEITTTDSWEITSLPTAPDRENDTPSDFSTHIDTYLQAFQFRTLGELHDELVNKKEKEVIKKVANKTYVTAKDGREIDITHLGLDVYDTKIRHELKRFSTMTEIQLFTRLGKIKQEQKLINYSRIAKIFGYPDLEIAALARCKRLHGYSPVPLNFEPKEKPKQLGERLLRSIKI